jgi:hypothetical protein
MEIWQWWKQHRRGRWKLGVLEEPHAENEKPPPPRIERKTISFTSKANLAVIDHLNAIYDTKVMFGDGNCGFRF